MGGPDTNTDRGKQSICAVMASGGFPDNGYFRINCRMHMLICVTILTRGQFWPSGIVVACVCMCVSVCPSIMSLSER